MRDLGFEEADDVRFLVLELVESTTLVYTVARAPNLHQNGGGLPRGEDIGIVCEVRFDSDDP